MSCVGCASARPQFQLPSWDEIWSWISGEGFKYLVGFVAGLIAAMIIFFIARVL